MFDRINLTVEELTAAVEQEVLLGGKLAVWSELDSGTEVALRIPASRAYEASPARRRSWLAEKLKGKLAEKDTEAKS